MSLLPISYFIVHTGAGPILWIVNILIYLIIALIVWLVIKWVAAEFGVDPRIIKLIGLLLFLLLVLSLFVGCVTTETRSPDGTITRISRQDPKVVKAISTAVANAAAQAAKEAIEDQINKQNGQP